MKDDMKIRSGINELKELKPENVMLAKYHSKNKKWHYCTLKEFWQNGFHNGQTTMEETWHKKRLLCDKDNHNGETYYATHKFLSEWDSFWYDNDNEIKVLITNEGTS